MDDFHQRTAKEIMEILQNQGLYMQNSMNGLAGELYRSATEYAGWANSFQRTLDANLKKRKKCSGICELAVADNRLVLLENYEDGTGSKIEIAPGLPSTFRILKLKGKILLNAPCYFLVLFLDAEGNATYSVVGEESRISPKYLYECFLCAEISFSSVVSQRRVSEALYRFFMPKIRNASEEIRMIELAGWRGENFFYAENVPYGDFGIKLDLPVMRKHFEVSEKSGEISDYLAALKKVIRHEDRLLLLSYPCAGVISSILARYGCPIATAVNFVMIDATMEKVVMSFLKIFNRTCLHPLSAMGVKSGLEQILSDTRDEVLCVEMKIGNLLSAYQKQKQEKNKEKCLNYAFARGSVGTETEFNPFALAMFSDLLFPKHGVINILVNDDFCNDAEDCLNILQNGGFQRTIGSFVEYVGSNYFDIILHIESCAAEGGRDKFWRALLPIIEDFWKDLGISIWYELQIPNEIDPATIFEMDFEEDWSEIFIHRFRQYFPSLQVLPKEAQSKNGSAAIYYNAEFLWIVPDAFEHFLHDSGLFEAKNRILCALNESGILVTDGDGYKRKFTINGKRKEVYQFRRERFNKTGLPDIIALAKEEKRC